MPAFEITSHRAAVVVVVVVVVMWSDGPDDDEIAAIDINDVVAARRTSLESHDDAQTTTTRPTSAARMFDLRNDQSGASTSLASTRGTKPHVWMDVIDAKKCRLSCSRERYENFSREAFGGGKISRSDAEPATPAEDAAAAWDIPMHALRRVQEALYGVDAFLKTRSNDGRRVRYAGAVPRRTAEFLSAPPGYCGRTKSTPSGIEKSAAKRFESITPGIRKALYPFQEQGVRFALERNGRALIADQMGVGKTLQAIAVADAYRDEGPLLCVVPASMRYVWADELERWMTDLTPRLLSVIFGSSDKFMLEKLAAECKGGWKGGRRVVVTSYHMLTPLLPEFKAVRWGCVIADESHMMHTNQKFGKDETKMTQAAFDLVRNARYAVLTTGTPSLTKPFDMYRQVEALRPGMLGDKWEFADNYCDMRFENGRSDVTGGSRLLELRLLLSHTMMIRRLKRDVMGDLPPKRRQVVPIDISEAVSNVGGVKLWSKIAKASKKPRDDMQYDSIDDEANILEDDEEEGAEYVLSKKILSLEKGMSVSASQIVGLLKVTPIVEWLKCGLLEDDSMQIVIFAHHQGVLDELERQVCLVIKNNDRGSYIRIDGATPADERKPLVDKFREGAALDDRGVVGVRIALLSVKAAGVGLDFSTASCVVFAELPDDASLLEQAEDRAHRRGNESGVNVYFLCARGGGCSHDEDRWNRLERSLNLCREALDGDDSRNGLDVDAYGTGLKLEPTANTGKPKPIPSKAASVSPQTRKPSPEIDNHPLWFEVSAVSGRLHLYGPDGLEGRKPIGASVSRSQLVRASVSEKQMQTLPEPLRTDRRAFDAAMTFSDTWNAMLARDRNLILARQQPCKAHELNDLAESLRNGAHVSNAATGSTTRHGSALKALPKGYEWKVIPVKDGRFEHEVSAPSVIDADTGKLKFLCVRCMGELPRMREEELRSVDLFCQRTCYEEHNQMKNATSLRRELEKRERGVCVECNLDCNALVRQISIFKSRSKRAAEILKTSPNFGARGNRTLLTRLARTAAKGHAWECDHKIAVFEGGGMCTVENCQTLCVVCHRKKTKAQATQRARNRAIAAEAAARRKAAPIKPLSESEDDENTQTMDDDDLININIRRALTNQPSTNPSSLPSSKPSLARKRPHALDTKSGSDDDDVDDDDDDELIRPIFPLASRANIF